MSTLTPGVTAAAGTRPDAPGTTEAELIAAAVLTSPYVVELHGGQFGEVATYLPGRRVVGVRLRPDHPRAGESPTATVVEVHVTTRYPTAIADLDASVRAAVQSTLSPRRYPVSVSIVIGDIVADQPVIGGPAGDRPVPEVAVADRVAARPVAPAVVDPAAQPAGTTGPVPDITSVEGRSPSGREDGR